MPSRRYSLFQKEIIRHELSLLRCYGTDDNPGPMTWKIIVDLIVTYGGLELSDYHPNDDDGAFEQNKDASLKSTKFYTNKLQEFYNNPNKKFPNSGMPIDDLLIYVEAFLTHPKVARLTSLQMLDPIVGIDAGHRLVEFAWEGIVSPSCEPSFDKKTFSRPETKRGKKMNVHLSFESTDHCHLFSVVELVEFEGNIASRAFGWACILPYQSMDIYVKNNENNEFSKYNGNYSSDYILFFPFNAIDLYEYSGDKVSKIDFFRKFSYNKFEIKFNRKVKRSSGSSLKFSEASMFTILMDDLQKEKGQYLIETLLDVDVWRFDELIKGGANVNFQNPSNGWTPLHYIAHLGRRDELRIISKIKGLDYLITNNDGHIPMELAALNSFSDPVVLRYLQMQSSKQFINRKIDESPKVEPVLPILDPF